MGKKVIDTCFRAEVLKLIYCGALNLINKYMKH